MFNVDKENINLSKNKIVKNKSLKINTNKKNKINGHDDVLDDNNSISKSSVSSKKLNKRECYGWIKESSVTI